MLSIFLSTTWGDTSDKDPLAIVTHSLNVLNTFKKSITWPPHSSLKIRTSKFERLIWIWPPKRNKFSPSEFHLALFLSVLHSPLPEASVWAPVQSPVSAVNCERSFQAWHVSSPGHWAGHLEKLAIISYLGILDANDFCKYPQTFPCKESSSEDQNINIVF